MTVDPFLHTHLPDQRAKLSTSVPVSRGPRADNHARMTVNRAGRFGTHVNRTNAGQLVAAGIEFRLFRDARPSFSLVLT
jgi:hypothetical protein